MSKPYLDYQQQIQKLTVQKGLIINNPLYAQQKLIDIGYFSLIGGYKTPFINPMTRKYDIPTKFEDIFALYQFDKNLRQLTFEYLIDIEQKVRQLISNSFCTRYGEQQSYYLSPASYSADPKHIQSISKLTGILNKLANNDTEHPYIVHQRNSYNNVPLWVLTKALTFGQLAKMYGVLQYQQQCDVSKSFLHVSEKELGQYLNSLTSFRNVCAHNERLYNHKLKQRDFPDKAVHSKLLISKKGNQYLQGKNDYFGLVIAFRYMLSREDFLDYKRRLKKIISNYFFQSKRLKESELLNVMGFPADWERIARFRL